MNRIFYALPYPLKVLAASAAACPGVYKKYGRYFDEYFHFLISHDIEEQHKKANEELETFFAWLKKNNPYYGPSLSTGMDVKKLPVIDKTIVLKNYDKIFMGQAFFVGKSSGTTGQPLAVPYSKKVYQKEYAFWWYHRSFGGVRRGDRVATLAGHKIADVNRDVPPFWVYNAVENQMFFSSYHMSPRNLGFYVEKLNSYRPSFIHGYPSSLYLLAKYIIDNNIEIQFRPSMIVGSSETVLDYQRKAIEDAFLCKLFVWYGNTEFCGHITECRHGHLHVQPYHSLIRVLKDDGRDAGPGETGKIVATNFSNYAFPLINYDVKDVVKIASEQKCECRKGGMIVEYIEGRIEDYVVTPDGRMVGRLDHLLKDAKYVKNAQIVQENINQITVRIEKEAKYSQNTERDILREARIRLGQKMAIEFEYVDEIEREKNGKFRFVVQKMDMRNRARDTSV
jgi:phenylacetate-CoA ligase